MKRIAIAFAAMLAVSVPAWAAEITIKFSHVVAPATPKSPAFCTPLLLTSLNIAPESTTAGTQRRSRETTISRALKRRARSWLTRGTDA